MGTDWRRHEISDLIAEGKIFIGDGYRAKNEELSTSGLPFARAGNISDGFQFQDADYFPEQNLSRVGNKISQPGDVVFTSKGTVGRFAFVKEDTPRFVYSPQLCFWRSLDRKNIEPRFLYYWMLGREFYIQFKGVAGQTDMAEYVSLTDQRRMHITLPSPPEQRAIVEILGSLDDKIELNRQMNETLEAIAQAIFKDWFVDFAPVRSKAEGRPSYLSPELWSLFPSTLAEDDKPEGWFFEKLGIVTAVSIGRTPSRARQECFIPPPIGISWLSIRDMGNIKVYAIDSSENLTEEAVKEFRVPIVPADTVIVSFKLTVGRVAITNAPMTTNEAIAHLVIDDSRLASNKYLYCYMKSFDYNSLGSTSSIATAVNSESIRQIDILLPAPQIQKRFEEIVNPLFEKIRANLHESRTLIQLRDLLLSRLISGEIRLTDAEDTIGGVL